MRADEMRWGRFKMTSSQADVMVVARQRRQPVAYSNWLINLLCWDGILPVGVALAPFGIKLVLPDNRGAIEIAAVTLPIAALLMRFFVGKRLIAVNHCGQFFRGVHATLRLAALLAIGVSAFSAAHSRLFAADLPEADAVKVVKLLEVPNYCEGVVFDREGRGYISWKDSITQFTLDGRHKVWAVTGGPNGHKILADGTHLVCDHSRREVLRLDPEGKLLAPASRECDGKPLRGPNDLCLDTPHRGFYFTDPGGWVADTRIGAVHYVDAMGRTHLCAEGLAYPNGIVLTTDGQRLFVAESTRNRVLEFAVQSPGKLGEKKVFAELPKNTSGNADDNAPDGMCLDTAGNLYVAHNGMTRVQVLDTTGKLIRSYPGGNMRTSNVAFGGPNRDQLFIAGGINPDGAPGGLFRIDLGVPGMVILPQ